MCSLAGCAAVGVTIWTCTCTCAPRLSHAWILDIDPYRAFLNQALGGLGSIYTSLKQYSKAATYHQNEVEESRVLGNGFVEARALDNLGLAFR